MILLFSNPNFVPLAEHALIADIRFQFIVMYIIIKGNNGNGKKPAHGGRIGESVHQQSSQGIVADHWGYLLRDFFALFIEECLSEIFQI